MVITKAKNMRVEQRKKYETVCIQALHLSPDGNAEGI